jgi:hypothetical protein
MKQDNADSKGQEHLGRFTTGSAVGPLRAVRLAAEPSRARVYIPNSIKSRRSLTLV